MFATFKEFYKCWRSGTKARVTIESVNGKAFVNFSAFLGHPDDAHFKSRPPKRKPSNVGPRKKSDKKTKRDNDRAARFQEKKRKEEEAASALKLLDNPEASLTSPGAESVTTISDMEFTFASPLAENLRKDSNDPSENKSFNSSNLSVQEDTNYNNDNIGDIGNISNIENVENIENIKEDFNFNVEQNTYEALCTAFEHYNRKFCPIDVARHSRNSYLKCYSLCEICNYKNDTPSEIKEGIEKRKCQRGTACELCSSFLASTWRDMGVNNSHL